MSQIVFEMASIEVELKEVVLRPKVLHLVLIVGVFSEPPLHAFAQVMQTWHDYCQHLFYVQSRLLF